MDQLTRSHSAARARDIVSNHHFFIFPNVYLFDDLIRVIQPIALEETEIYSHPFRPGGVPGEFNTRRLYEVTRQLSTTGLVNPADLEMFTANQTGLHARHRGIWNGSSSVVAWTRRPSSPAASGIGRAR